MKFFLYKAKKSLLSCFLLTTSIGFCYAFSLFAPYVTLQLGVSKAAVQFAFCLNIFFLGTGASCFGAMVEKNIKKAAWLSTALLFSGLLVSGAAMHIRNVWIFYIGMGVLCGLAEGVGYVVPVKNLLLFFGKSRHKALIMAISIVSFGLGSSICSYVFKYAFPIFGVENVFFFFAGLYFILTAAASHFIDKPLYAKLKLKKETKKTYSVLKYVTDQYFIRCWLFMFLNISMGLIIIGQCAGMLAANGLASSAVITVMMLCGFSNGLGRLVFPAISDYIKNRMNILLIALGLEIIAMVFSIFDAWIIPVAFVIVNACYGCGFAMAPSILSDRYGKSELSFCHGLLLSAWGIASVFAFIVSTCVLNILQLSQNTLFLILAAVYFINFGNIFMLKYK